MVIVLGLHAVAPCSNPVLTSGQDLFPVVPDSTLPRFGCLLPVGVLNHVSVQFRLLRVECLFRLLRAECL